MIKTLLVSALLGAVLITASGNAPFDIQTKVTQMRQKGQTCAGGTSQKFGLYIISLVEVETDKDVSMNEAAEIALAQGKKEIASFIGQTVSAKDSTASRIKTVNGKTESEELHESLISINVDQFLRGVVLYDTRKTERGISAVCLVTGRTMDMSEELRKQIEQNPPGTVSALGIAYITDNRQDTAKQQALQAALRLAVEQVLGTTIAGNTQVQDNAKVRSKIFAHASGFVEEYRVISEETVNDSYRTMIYAKVSKDKLLDSYSSYLKSFGDPEFFLSTDNKELYLTFNRFFSGLGLKMTTDPKAADYLINALGDYRELQHPASGVPGVQLSLWIRICDAKNNQELLSQKNDPRKSAVFHSSGERQKDIATEKAFAQIRQPLHEALNKMIGNMAASGRNISVIIDNYSPTYADAVDTFCKALEMVPGCGSVNRKINQTTQEVIISTNYQGKMDDLEMFLRNRLEKDIPEKRFIPKTVSIETNRLKLTY